MQCKRMHNLRTQNRVCIVAFSIQKRRRNMYITIHEKRQIAKPSGLSLSFLERCSFILFILPCFHFIILKRAEQMQIQILVEINEDGGGGILTVTAFTAKLRRDWGDLREERERGVWEWEEEKGRFETKGLGEMQEEALLGFGDKEAPRKAVEQAISVGR